MNDRHGGIVVVSRTGFNVESLTTWLIALSLRRVCLAFDVMQAELDQVGESTGLMSLRQT